MIDVRIRMRQTPEFWVLSKVRVHIFVDQTLKVDADFSISPNQNVGANPAFERYVAIGICDYGVSRIIVSGHPDLTSGSDDQAGNLTHEMFVEGGGINGAPIKL